MENYKNVCGTIECQIDDIQLNRCCADLNGGQRTKIHGSHGDTICARKKNHAMIIYLFIIRNNYVVNHFTIKKRSKKIYSVERRKRANVLI